MSDDEILEPSDRDRINLEEDYEVKAWCQMFGVTSIDLKHAIEVVGPSALKVKYYFKARELNTNSPVT